MDVEVHLYGPFQEPVGKRELSIELPSDATLEDAIDRLAEEYPVLEDRLLEDGELVRSAIATRNEKSVRQLGGLDTELSEGDVLRFAPPIEGGVNRND